MMCGLLLFQTVSLKESLSDEASQCLCAVYETLGRCYEAKGDWESLQAVLKSGRDVALSQAKLGRCGRTAAGVPAFCGQELLGRKQRCTSGVHY